MVEFSANIFKLVLFLKEKEKDRVFFCIGTAIKRVSSFSIEEGTELVP